ncbi:VOC family protein [Tumidithrix elongata RA019]|uniref:VOC family protein n=1 Tax=Tumidithrix elongata BACA0141 TaxID=2716417 RepID=A0AAW9Q748_9CYAN|nr:VOC family protein [Tumidithrix elongata RA019]
MESLFSTQGVMIMLLGAYAVAMWMFLTSAPKVHTLMVSDMEQAKYFYEGQLQLPIADVPLHYYYGYEHGLTAGTDPIYLPSEARTSRSKYSADSEGAWYQLQKNIQLHVVPGANVTEPNRGRHICFNRDCVEQVLLRIQMKGVKHKIRSEKPLKFLVKDPDGQVIEIAEVVT